ncbi:MAG TPA: YgiQ family radical SAM protein [Bacteroidetes bacterium]|nr:YgiQ family radical SAM protein [Bacteroidota bacterium]
MTTLPITRWLPTTLKEVRQQGWDELDVILFTGDAYVDHPSFGAAVIGRVLEYESLHVAIVPQPNWKDDLRDFRKLGKPKLFFGVTSGNMDSMINHYTANKRRRSDDAFSPEGKAGFRPDYATVVYSQILKKLFPDVPIVLGGIEASLRRFTHFDYWSESLKPSILKDSQADLLVYGNGEKPIIELVNLLKKGVPFEKIHNIPQTALLVDRNYEIKDNFDEELILNSHEKCLKNKILFAENFKTIETESNSINAKRLVQYVGEKKLIVNPPYKKISEREIDHYFDLPYTRLPHPKYKNRGKIPAYEMIKFSVTLHRGCFGGCSFCTISAHQGKFIISRSEKSILCEVEKITKMPDFSGHITDLGGPSANMYKMQGKNINLCQKCKRFSCIFPSICNNLDTNHNTLLNIYRKVRKIPNIKKATIGSGIRYDLLFDKNGKIEGDKKDYARELIKYHVSGRLKVAPEHTSNIVLKVMRKPTFRYFYMFKNFFDNVNSSENLNQQLIPYFISSHPASTCELMAELAVETKKMNFHLEQVQDLTPTPLTASAVMYYTGYDPYTKKQVYTAKTQQEKLEQRMFFFWYRPENKKTIKQKLLKLGRNDLISALFHKK